MPTYALCVLISTLSVNDLRVDERFRVSVWTHRGGCDANRRVIRFTWAWWSLDFER